MRAAVRSATTTPARRRWARRGRRALDETKAVTGAFDGMALADGKAKGKAAVVEFGRCARRRVCLYPGSAAEDKHLAPAAPRRRRRRWPRAASSVVLNKYHPSAKRDAKPDSIALGRRPVSAPSAGRSQAGRAGGAEPGGVLLRVPERRRHEGALGGPRAVVVGARPRPPWRRRRRRAEPRRRTARARRRETRT